MSQKTFFRTSFWLPVIILILTACHKSSDLQHADQEATRIDSLLIQYDKNILQDVEGTKQQVFSAQKSLTDSLNYYKLASVSAKCYFYQSKIDSAIIFTKQIISFCTKQEGNPALNELQQNACNALGIFFQAIDRRDSAIIYIEKAASIARSANNKEKLIDIYINLADNFTQDGKFIPASDYYRKSMLLADSLNLHNKYEAPINTGLAQIYTYLKNFKFADYYYQQVDRRFDSLPAHEQLHFANTRGNYYYTAKEYEKALPWFHKARTISLQFGDEGYKSIAEINLGEIHLLLNHNDSAKYYLDKVAPAFFAPDASPAIAFYLRGLYASLYLQSNQTNKAEQLLLMPYDTACINPVYLYFHDKRLEELYKQKGDYQKAYLYSNKAQKFDNETRNTEVQNNIEELNFRYSQDTTVLKKSLIIQQNEQQVMRLNYLLTFLISFFVIAVLIIFVARTYRKRKQEQEYAKQVGLITELRMENVRNRMSPHFIFNALNSLMPGLREHPDLNKPVEYLIRSIRGNLTNSDKMTIALEDEIQNVKNYICLLESLKWKLPTIAWEVDKNVDLHISVPSMSIQIPVENVIKYAFEEKTEDDLLEISIQNDGVSVLINITDNGTGFNPEIQKPGNSGTGNGLKILYKTIEILNARNVEKIKFNIQNKQHINPDLHGTSITMNIPLNYKYEL